MTEDLQEEPVSNNAGERSAEAPSGSNRAKTLLGLHLLLAVYSLCSICGKLASGFEFLSLGFVLSYGGMIAVLGIYAIGWQQVIKRMPLTSAYANKAATIIWGIIWGALLFHEEVTPLKVLGALIVLAGVVLFSLSDSKESSGQNAGGAEEERL